jgi:hypothetical protein
LQQSFCNAIGKDAVRVNVHGRHCRNLYLVRPIFHGSVTPCPVAASVNRRHFTDSADAATKSKFVKATFLFKENGLGLLSIIL